MAKKERLMETLKLIFWYEMVALISSITMAIRYSWRIVYAWWDLSVDSSIESASHTLSEYTKVFAEELVRGLPTLLIIAVIALIVAVIHSYLRKNK